MRRDRSSHRAPRTDVGTRTRRTTLLPRLPPHPTVMSPACPRSAKLLPERHVHPRQALDRVPVGDRLAERHNGATVGVGAVVEVTGGLVGLTVLGGGLGCSAVGLGEGWVRVAGA